MWPIGGTREFEIETAMVNIGTVLYLCAKFNNFPYELP